MQLCILITVCTIGLLDNVTIKNNLYFLCDIVNDKNSLKKLKEKFGTLKCISTQATSTTEIARKHRGKNMLTMLSNNFSPKVFFPVLPKKQRNR